jgi:hypothetical protein
VQAWKISRGQCGSSTFTAAIMQLGFRKVDYNLVAPTVEELKKL